MQRYRKLGNGKQEIGNRKWKIVKKTKVFDDKEIKLFLTIIKFYA